MANRFPRRGHRPSAFNVSWPDEAVAGPSTYLSTNDQETTGVKRKSEEEARIWRVEKRHAQQASGSGTRGRIPRTQAFYKPKAIPDEKEQINTLLPGEDLDNEPGTKRTRGLHSFAFVTERNEFKSLEDVADGFYAVGYVTVHDDNSEDAGQEDDGSIAVRRLRTTRVLRVKPLNYLDANDPIRIETEHAVYILGDPEHAYSQIYHGYFQDHRIAQLLLSTAWNDRDASLQDTRCTENELSKAAAFLPAILSKMDVETTKLLRSSLLLGEVLSLEVRPMQQVMPRTRLPPPLRHVNLPYDETTIDADVFKTENLTQTHVTPFVERAAGSFFRERLYIVGNRLPQPAIVDNSEHHREELLRCIESARVPDITRRVRAPRKSPTVTVEGVDYTVGDVVLIRDEHSEELPSANDVPDDARIEHYFSFAKILSLDSNSQTAHIMYYAHVSLTDLYLGSASDDRELLFTTHCEDRGLQHFYGKVAVTKLEGAENIPEHIDTLYFSRFLYHDTDPSFVDYPKLPAHAKPSYCPTCDWTDDYERDPELRTHSGVRALRTSDGIDYHVNDYILVQNTESVLMNSNPSVGIICRITGFNKADRLVLGILLERQVDFKNKLQDEDDVLLDERELFLTKLALEVPFERVVRKVHVRAASALDDRDAWIRRAPDRFIVRWRFTSTLSFDYDARREARACHLPQCTICVAANDTDDMRREQFAESLQPTPLRVLDLFSGSGAFSLAVLEGFPGPIELKHAIEISPSAAQSLKKYSPETVVFNQCANSMLAYTMKCARGNLNPEKDVTKNLDGTPLPHPPRKGEVDVLVGGFPCQPHSTLNRHQKGGDRKSSLMLTMLSYIDELRPLHVLLENVPGFFNYELPTEPPLATGARGSGLRLFTAVMMSMGYQVRCVQLNAAHFGAPQKRIRFFLLASRAGHPLALDPQPTHAFDTGKLALRIEPRVPPPGPILPNPGEFLFAHTTIEDAIGDLWAFDAHNPGARARRLGIALPNRGSADPGLLAIRRRLAPPGGRVPAVRAPEVGDGDEEDAGFLKCPYDGYARAPRTTYQKCARARIGADNVLQHYTRTLNDTVTEQVCNIPLKKDADFRQLPAGLFSWQLHDPGSHSSRDNFTGRYFARLDAHGVFGTVVTNILPTAKQSRVLHPWCDRLPSVRELARAQGYPDDYEFVALNRNAVTIHRQIGNAVPWQVGRALGRELFEAMYWRWKEEQGYQ